MDFNVSTEEMFSLGAAVAIIPVIVGHLKPALRRVWPEDGPWELIADVVGVLWVLGIWQAGYAPESVSNPWAAAITGLALGIASSRVRDAAQVVAPGSRSFVRDDDECQPWAGVAPDSVPPGLVGTTVTAAGKDAPRESRSIIKAT